MTVFYRFPDEQTFSAHRADVQADVIGLIQSGETTVTTEDGSEEVIPVFVEGFHVNALQAVEGWEEYLVSVKSPVRIYG